jgi:hypothetical protein
LKKKRKGEDEGKEEEEEAGKKFKGKGIKEKSMKGIRKT